MKKILYTLILTGFLIACSPNISVRLIEKYHTPEKVVYSFSGKMIYPENYRLLVESFDTTKTEYNIKVTKEIFEKYNIGDTAFFDKGKIK